MTPFDPPHTLAGMAAMVLLLGMKHGFDADHLAAIDAIARANAVPRPRLARLTGFWFALGHGAVVLAVAVAAALASAAWQPPPWLDRVGAWVSISILVLLALGNLRTVLAARPGEPARPVGCYSALFARWLAARSAWGVLAVGALFALSFDTLSQAALFAVTSTRFGGWTSAALLAALFIVGMLVTDGINGVWMARLIRQSDRAALVASRVMSLAVAGVGLLTAGVGVAVQTSPSAEAWLDGKALWLGAAVIGIVTASFLLGVVLARRPAGRGAWIGADPAGASPVRSTASRARAARPARRGPSAGAARAARATRR